MESGGSTLKYVAKAEFRKYRSSLLFMKYQGLERYTDKLRISTEEKLKIAAISPFFVEICRKIWQIRTNRIYLPSQALTFYKTKTSCNYERNGKCVTRHPIR